MCGMVAWREFGLGSAGLAKWGWIGPVSGDLGWVWGRGGVWLVRVFGMAVLDAMVVWVGCWEGCLSRGGTDV
jgi:hypothetical protein